MDEDYKRKLLEDRMETAFEKLKGYEWSSWENE